MPLARRLATALVCLLAWTLAAAAAGPGDAPSAATYAVVDQDLRDVIAGIAVQLRLHANISQAVQGHVHGRMLASSSRDMLEQLAGLYGFDWYRDGDVLWVSASDEAASKVLATAPAGAAAFVQLLHDLDIADARWPIRTGRSDDIAVVSGPPHYVALAEQALSVLAHRAQTITADVHVFRGSAASGP